MSALIPYAEALDLILAAARSFGLEEVGLANAGGRVLADDLAAPFAGPRFDNSAVDGYAIGEEARQALETSGRVALRVSGAVPAGATADGVSVEPGLASRVYTGSRLPEGTTAVVMQEDAAISEEDVLLTGAAPRGMHMRRAGDEYKKGDLLLTSGALLTPGAIALAASVGKAHLVVRRAPKVALITTGTELVDPGAELPSAGIYESNSFGLWAALKEFSGCLVHRVRVKDDLEQTRIALNQALESNDVVITSGGASVGDYDHISEAFSACDVASVFHGVAIKPGKPFALGMFEGKAVFALPGNPLSSLVCYAVFVAPFLRACLGLSTKTTPEKALLRSSVSKKPGRLEFVPAVLREGVVDPARNRASNMMTGFASANSLIVVPAESEGLAEGTLVDCLMLPWG